MPGKRRLADARDVLDQKVTAREQTGDREFNRLVLSYNDFTNLLREGINVIGHPEIICGTARFANRICNSCSRGRLVPP